MVDHLINQIPHITLHYPLSHQDIAVSVLVQESIRDKKI